MTEIKVRSKKKATRKKAAAPADQAIELIHGNRYVYAGKIYERNHVYSVPARVAEYLLEEAVTDSGYPYFRPVVGERAEEAVTPPTRAKADLQRAKTTRRKKVTRRRKAAPEPDADEGVEIT